MTTKEYAINLMLGGALTRSGVDNARAVLMLKADPDSLPIVLAKRKAWVEQVTLWQRRWQRETRNRNKARHHDSIAIREKYVRA